MSAEDRRARHRSVYGLIFVLVVYAGLLVMLGVAWPRFVEEMLLPRIERERVAAWTDPAPPPADRESLTTDLPATIQVLYRASLWLRTPVAWAILLVPVVLGVVFEARVRDDALKTYVYYGASAILGLSILGGACLVIFEVLEFAKPPGG